MHRDLFDKAAAISWNSAISLPVYS